VPTRIVRDGILTSERIARLNFAEEVFYRRLMSVVDDHGRYYANNSLIRAAAYPLLLGKVSDSDIGKWLTACVEAALVRVYPASDGKRYIEIIDFGQRVNGKPKFPDPTEVPRDSRGSPGIPGDSPVTPGISRLVGVGVGDVVEGEGVSAARAPPPARKGKQQKRELPADFAVSERVERWAASSGHGRLVEHLEAFKRKCQAKGYAYADWDAAFMEAVRQDWAKLGAVSAQRHKTPEQTKRETTERKRVRIIDEPQPMNEIMALLNMGPQP
jgi:hypothetical protein